MMFSASGVIILTNYFSAISFALRLSLTKVADFGSNLASRLIRVGTSDKHTVRNLDDLGCIGLGLQCSNKSICLQPISGDHRGLPIFG